MYIFSRELYSLSLNAISSSSTTQRRWLQSANCQSHLDYLHLNWPVVERAVFIPWQRESTESQISAVYEFSAFHLHEQSGQGSS